MNLSKAMKDYKVYLSEIDAWVDSEYTNLFLSSFEKVHTLYERFKSDACPITDAELEELLTYVPLELFSVSENLNRLRTHRDIIKLQNKLNKEKKLYEIQGLRGEDGKKLFMKSEASKCVEAEFADDEILLIALSQIISRVETEISFSKELIMTAKKIWDRRKSIEEFGKLSEPTSSVDTENLPEYEANIVSKEKKKYIK